MMRSTTLGFVLAACCAVAAPVAWQRPAPFRSGADAVLLDVQVKAKGQPVAGLTAANFEVTDSGVPQQIHVIGYADVPVSLILALDVSASVRGNPLDELKAAAHAAIDTLRPGDEASLLSFSQRVSVRSPWTTDRAAIANDIGALTAGGRTSLYDAIVTAMALRDRAAGRVAVLVFTDGTDTSSWFDGPAVLDAARKADVIVYAISSEAGLVALGPAQTLRAGPATPHVAATALREWFDLEPRLFPYAFLDKLADETGGETLYAGSGRDLTRAFSAMAADLRTRYLVTYTPTGVPASGWHPIEVRLKGKEGTIRARRGYTR